jgi:hypothetical protein
MGEARRRNQIISDRRNDVAVEVGAEVNGVDESSRRDSAAMIDAEVTMAQDVLRQLLADFPGYRWRVLVNFRQGVCGISLPIFMGPVQFYAVPLATFMTANDGLRAVREAGGNILERLRLSRAGLKLPEYVDLRNRRRVIRPLDKIPE